MDKVEYSLLIMLAVFVMILVILLAMMVGILFTFVVK